MQNKKVKTYVEAYLKGIQISNPNGTTKKNPTRLQIIPQNQ